MANRELLDDWEWTTVGECSTVITGGTPSKKDASNYGNFMPFVKPPELTNESIFTAEDNISEKGTKEARVLPVNSVLVSCIGNLGKTGINRVPVAFNQQINAVIFPENIIPEFGFYYFQSSEFKRQLEDISSSTTVAIVNKSKFSSLPFPIAPLPEQERIVAKIEELFTQLEAGTSALAKVQAGLRRYKASVLKAAVEGKLGIQNDEYRMGEGELPEGWQQVEFKEIITSLKNGYFYGRPSSEPIGIPILRISAVRPMSVNYSDLRYVPEIAKDEIQNYFLSKGDLLFTRYNGNLGLVGACGLVRENSPHVIYPDKLIRVRVQEVALPEYLEIYFATIIARKLIESRVKSTAGQHGISGGDIKSISVILPPLQEQRRIVAEVERRLSVAREVESVVEKALARAVRLRQAVLKSAFEGRL
jgi:type I restriction enzyme, S subunit